MPVSLPTDKLPENQKYALSLLQAQPDTVCKVMSFIEKANFCVNRCAQLCCFCGMTQSNMLYI